jgi:hypothetical protein
MANTVNATLQAQQQAAAAAQARANALAAQQAAIRAQQQAAAQREAAAAQARANALAAQQAAIRAQQQAAAQRAAAAAQARANALAQQQAAARAQQQAAAQRAAAAAQANAQALAQRQQTHSVIPSRTDAAPAAIHHATSNWDASAHSDAVNTAHLVVTKLEDEIGNLEAQNNAKVSTVTQLTQQLAQRKAEIQQQWNQKRSIGIIGALFGMPLVTAASLITMQNDDGRIQQINRDLATAQADQQRIAGKLAQYTKLKSGVESQIKTLEAPIAQSAGAPTDVAKLLTSAETLRRLESEKVLLSSVRDAAKAIGLDLDATMGRLSTAVASADKALEASRHETLELIKTLLSPDPNQAAFDMLKGMAKDKIKQMFAPNVDSALSGVAAGPLKDQLRSQLLSAVADAILG